MGTSMRHRRRGVYLRAMVPLCVTLLVSCAACGEGSNAWEGTVVDSAGVALVTNPSTGLWGSGEGWTLEEDLSIGVAEGDPTLQFGQIIGVDVDAEGVIYVADILAHEVRAFGPDGSYLRTIGSAGGGPEELGMAIAGPFLADGDVRVPDLENQRVSRFSPEGEFLGSFRLDFTRGIPMRWDEVAGDVLVAQLRRMDPTAAASAPAVDLVVSFTDGAVGDTLLVLPPGESFQMGGGTVRMRLFASEPVWDAGDDGRLVSGRNSEYRIEVRGPAGALRQVVSMPFELRPVTEHDQQVILDAVAEAAALQGTPPQVVDMLLQQMTFAEEYPAFASVLAGPQGSLWVQRVRTGTELGGESATFDVQDLG